MDGSVPGAGLGDLLLAALADAGVEATAEQTAQLAENYLAFFRRQGLLISS